MRTRAIFMSLVLAAGACGGGGADPDGGADDDDDGGGGPDGGTPLPLVGSIRVIESEFAGGSAGQVDGELVADGLPSFHVEEMNDGTCRLLMHRASFCDPACTDGWCVDGECRPFPAFVDAGRLTVTGLKTAVEVDPSYCGFNGYGYCAFGLPDDLYDPGDTVTASAPGAAFPGFSVMASAVAPLQSSSVANDEITVPNGGDYIFTWTPGTGGTRVRLTINANSSGGHGSPYQGIIVCDSPDDGSLTIPQEMIEAFPETYRWEICAGSDCPLSNAMRYAAGDVAVGDGRVELLVGASLVFYVIHPAP